MTRITPLRLTTLQLRQIFLTDALTFIVSIYLQIRENRSGNTDSRVGLTERANFSALPSELPWCLASSSSLRTDGSSYGPVPDLQNP